MVGWCLVSILMLAGTSGAEAARPAPVPAPVAGAVLSLDLRAQDQQVHFLIGQERGDAPVAFVHLRRDDQAWSEPVTLTTSADAPYRHHRGSDAALAVQGQQLVAVWSAAGRGAMGSGAMVCAFSSDGGLTWQRGQPPAQEAFDGAAKHGHRFPALAADPRHPGRFHLFWIDAFHDQRRLGYTRSDDGGRTWSPARLIDEAICACCWNRAAVGPGGELAVLYRDTAPSDMGLGLLSADGERWQLGPAGAFEWQFNGCPHVGGGLAWTGGLDQPHRLHALVWTGQAEVGGLHYLETTGASGSFAAPHLLAENGRHADLAAQPDGLLLAVWDEVRDGQRVVAAAQRDVHHAWSASVTLSDPARHSSHPRAVPVQGRWLIVWTEHQEARHGTLMTVTWPSPER